MLYFHGVSKTISCSGRLSEDAYQKISPPPLSSPKAKREIVHPFWKHGGSHRKAATRASWLRAIRRDRIDDRGFEKSGVPVTLNLLANTSAHGGVLAPRRRLTSVAFLRQSKEL
jgi:hypothetical protein